MSDCTENSLNCINAIINLFVCLFFVQAVWDYFVLASYCVMSHQGWVKAVCLQHAVLELWLDYE